MSKPEITPKPFDWDKAVARFDRLLNIGLKLKREARASRGEVRAENRERRAEDLHENKKKFFGREI